MYKTRVCNGYSTVKNWLVVNILSRKLDQTSKHFHHTRWNSMRDYTNIIWRKKWCVCERRNDGDVCQYQQANDRKKIKNEPSKNSQNDGREHLYAMCVCVCRYDQCACFIYESKFLFIFFVRFRHFNKSSSLCAFLICWLSQSNQAAKWQKEINVTNFVSSHAKITTHYTQNIEPLWAVAF